MRKHSSLLRILFQNGSSIRVGVVIGFLFGVGAALVEVNLFHNVKDSAVKQKEPSLGLMASELFQSNETVWVSTNTRVQIAFVLPPSSMSNTLACCCIGMEHVYIARFFVEIPISSNSRLLALGTTDEADGGLVAPPLTTLASITGSNATYTSLSWFVRMRVNAATCKLLSSSAAAQILKRSATIVCSESDDRWLEEPFVGCKEKWFPEAQTWGCDHQGMKDHKPLVQQPWLYTCCFVHGKKTCQLLLYFFNYTVDSIVGSLAQRQFFSS